MEWNLKNAVLFGFGILTTLGTCSGPRARCSFTGGKGYVSFVALSFIIAVACPSHAGMLHANVTYRGYKPKMLCKSLHACLIFLHINWMDETNTRRITTTSDTKSLV